MGSHSVTCHPTQVNAPRLASPSQTGWYSINPIQRDEKLLWPRWLDTYRDGLPASADSHPSNPSSNRVQCTSIKLIETMMSSFLLSSCC